MSTNQTCDKQLKPVKTHTKIIHTTGEEKSQTDTSTGIGPIIGLQIIQAHTVFNQILLSQIIYDNRSTCNTEVELSCLILQLP